MKNNIIDLFCGCGGLSLGFEEAGFKPILAIDLWSDAIETYNFNRPTKPGKCIDISKLSNEELRKFKEQCIGVIGGPPCQGFSTVGKRDVNDPRNQLYKQYCRVVEIVQPQFFVLENVKGLLTLEHGFFKEDIKNRFEKLGYHVDFQLLNAADYGVPQNRYRVFFVGMKKSYFNFPKPHKEKVTCKEAISDLEDGYAIEPQSKYQMAMRSEGKITNHDFTTHTSETVSIISKIPDGGNIKDLPPEYWNVRKYNKAFERMSSEGQSNTVDTGHRNYFHYSKNRIPTVRENARLQSFPDSFFFCGTKTSQYKQVGNAVPPLLAKAIATAIKEQMKDV